MVREWQAVMRDLLQMAMATHEKDECDCEDIFREAKEILDSDMRVRMHGGKA